MTFDFEYFGNKKSQHFSLPFFKDNTFADNARLTFQIGQHVVLLHIQIEYIKGKGLTLLAEPHRIQLFQVPPPPVRTLFDS